jgi:hypothetical protein
VYYTHHDRLGSVMAISDESGTLSEQLAYEAWGKRRQQASPQTPDSLDGELDNKGFTGHEMLDRVDLVHMNGRVYDPLVARFFIARIPCDAARGLAVAGSGRSRRSRTCPIPGFKHKHKHERECRG